MTTTTKVEITLEIPTENIIAALTTAAEGGINYWLDTSDTDDFHDVSVRRNEESNVVHLAFSGKDGKRYSIGPSEIALAFAKILRCEAQVRDDLRAMITELPCEDCDIDAEGADVLVQVAAFGEIVYG